MSPFAFDFAVNVLLTVMGISFGWWARGSFSMPRIRLEDDESKKATRRAKESLARLRELAARVAADVGEHSHRVEEINEELSSAEGHETEVVVKAVAELVQANSRMQEQLASAKGKLQEQAKQLEHTTAEARTDALTSLANRRAFDDEIARLSDECRASGKKLSMVMIDVDHFKRFNDTHGHLAGDEVLRGIGRVLSRNIRENDLAARYGGEEFALLLPQMPTEQACSLVEQIRESIDVAHFHIAGTSLHATASLGLTEWMPGDDVTSFIERADAALYAAKQAGRNRSCWHDGTEIHPIARKQDAPAKPASSAPPADAPEPAPTADQSADPLARLVNRTAFCTLLNTRLAEFRRGVPAPSVILVRVDTLDQILREHGQAAIDLVRRTLAHFLIAAVREMDLVAWYDSATLAVLLPGTSLINAALVAERVRRAVAGCSLPVGGSQLVFTVSLGGAEANNGDDMERLLRRTELALDSAKRSGGNSSYYHNGQWSETATAFIEHSQPSSDSATRTPQN